MKDTVKELLKIVFESLMELSLLLCMTIFVFSQKADIKYLVFTGFIYIGSVIRHANRDETSEHGTNVPDQPTVPPMPEIQSKEKTKEDDYIKRQAAREVIQGIDSEFAKYIDEIPAAEVIEIDEWYLAEAFEIRRRTLFNDDKDERYLKIIRKEQEL